MHSGPRGASAIGMAVVVSLGILVFVVFTGLAIAGSYGLTLHEVHVQTALAESLKAKTAAAQVKASIPGCRTLQALNAASRAFATDRHQDTTGHHLAAAIEHVYGSSACGKLLTWVKDHVPYSVIAKRLGMGG